MLDFWFRGQAPMDYNEYTRVSFFFFIHSPSPHKGFIYFYGDMETIGNLKKNLGLNSSLSDLEMYAGFAKFTDRSLNNPF